MSVNPISNLRTLFLGKVLGVQRHEYLALFWSFAYFFCVLSSYYMLRPIREQLAVGSGPDTIPYLFLGTFVTMMILTPIFGWITSRIPRSVFLPWLYLFFVCNILIFWVIFQKTIGTEYETIWLGRAFFVWLSVFNLFVVSVFWSFMADIYSREQGRRMFGVISAGGSIGAIVGGSVNATLVIKIGFQNLLPISAAILLFAVVCIHQLRKWMLDNQSDETVASAKSDEPLGGSALGGVTHTLQSKYFSSMAAASIIASLLGTALYMFTAQLVSDNIAGDDERTLYFSLVDVATNTAALIGQLFILRNVVSRFGISIALAILPALFILSFCLLAIRPELAVVAFITFATRSARFSFSKPTSDMLFSVVTPEEKYKAKNFIDTAIYRFGDVVGTWSIKLILPLGLTTVSMIMVPFGAIWCLLSVWLGYEYHRRARELRDSGVQ